MSKEVQSVGERAKAICGAEAEAQDTLRDRVCVQLEHAITVLECWLRVKRDDGMVDDCELTGDAANAAFCDAVNFILERADALFAEHGKRNALTSAERTAWTLVGGVRDLLEASAIADLDSALSPDAGVTLLRALRQAFDALANDGANEVLQ